MKIKILSLLLTVLVFNIGYTKEVKKKQQIDNRHYSICIKNNSKLNLKIVRRANCDTFATLCMLAVEDLNGCLSSEEYNQGYKLFYGICRIWTS
jgi:hypothetical protein